MPENVRDETINVNNSCFVCFLFLSCKVGQMIFVSKIGVKTILAIKHFDQNKIMSEIMWVQKTFWSEKFS